MSEPLSVRLRALAHELIKFAVVGGFCFALDTGLSYALRFELGSHNFGPTTAKAVATIIATGVSYVGNRLWSFAHRIDADASHHKAMTLYAVINGIGLAVTLIPVAFASHVLHQNSKTAFLVSGVIGTAVATGFRFWTYRKYVFVTEPDLAERAALV